MALHIKADGTVETVQPQKGRHFTLPELQRYVGGYIELVPCVSPNRQMFINEEGKLKGLPVNLKATLLYAGEDPIVGDVLVTALGEVK